MQDKGVCFVLLPPWNQGGLNVFRGVDIAEVTYFGYNEVLRGGYAMKKILAVFFTLFLLFGTLMVASAAEKEQNTEEFSEQVRQEYDEARLISLAATTCAGTYVSAGEADEYSYLGQYGFVVNTYTVHDGDREANFMLAYNNKQVEGKKLYVLAFRGSASKKDWAVNLDTNKVEYGGTDPQEFATSAIENDDDTVPQVHKGYNDYVNAAFGLKPDLNGDNVAEDLFLTLRDDPNTMLLITGHSLGGAAATLFAERLVSMGVPKEKLTVVTFGAPAIGNEAFAEKYGDRINLLRVKTEYDPVPGGLQTFVGGFKQFGREKSFPLSSKFADYQHPMSYYFDLAMKNYYEACDKAIATGLIEPEPMQKLSGKGPVVAIVVGETKNIQHRPFTPNINRFILNEYRAVLPRYIVLNKSADLVSSDKYDLGDILVDANNVDADYVLVLEIDSKRIAQQDKWYILMNQVMFDKDGRMISLSSYGRRVTYDQGVMQCTIANLEQCRDDLKERLPWVYTRLTKK